MRLTDAILADGRRVDIAVADGCISSITPSAGGTGDIDLAGMLLLPGMIDGHVHLDKTLMGLPWRPNSGAPTVRDRIENERRARHGLALPVAERAAHLLRRMIANGTTALRTHVDIDDDIGLAQFHAIQGVAEAFRGQADIEIVAFPQSGIVSRAGVADLLDAALREGADLVGGLDPVAIDGDAAGHLDLVFALAQRHGKGIDMHLHELAPGGNALLRDIAARTAAAGLGGRVTVSHAFSLGTDDADDFACTADALAAAGVAILTSSPAAGPVPPVKPLLQRGVRLIAGSDNIRDLWSPFGNGDMLERAFLVCQRQGFRTDADIALAFALCAGRLEEGGPADLVAVRAETLAEAVAERPARAMVMKAGTIQPLRTF